MNRLEFFQKTNKRAGQIKASRVENPLEINKRACSSIRHSRVGRAKNELEYGICLIFSSIY